MKIETLDKCLYFLRNWREIDDNSLYKLLFRVGDGFGQGFIEPFRRELVENILTKESPEGKKMLMTFYINELNRARTIDNEVIEKTKWLDKDLKPIRDILGQGPTEGRLFAGTVHFLYILLLIEIQDSCNSYKIPFLEICSDVGFPVNIIPTIPTSAIEHIRNSTTVTELNEPHTVAEINPTITLKLKEKLKRHGFYTLLLVKDLTHTATEKLIEFISQNGLPYQIAMLDYLGFIKHIDKEYGTTKKVLFLNLADILSCTARSAKGNINVLNSYSKENKHRFTAHLYVETVKNDYEKVK